MHLSDDTTAVLEYLNTSIEGGLRKKNDIGVLLELGATSGDAEVFNTLTRTGKGLWNVYGTLRRVQPGAEGYPVLEREFGSLLNEVRELLASMLSAADDDVLKLFDEIYFGMTSGTIRNLVDLAHDLARLKDLQNDAR